MGKPTKNSGHTLIELLIVMGMFTIFFVASSFNLLGARSKTSLGTSVDTLLTDIRSQQTRAMSGDTDGTGTVVNYGVHFLSNSYVLFKNSYATDPNKFTITLDDVQVTSTFPSDEVIFSKGSGEIVSGGASVRLISTSSPGDPKIVTINRLGVIESVN